MSSRSPGRTKVTWGLYWLLMPASVPLVVQLATAAAIATTAAYHDHYQCHYHEPVQSTAVQLYSCTASYRTVPYRPVGSSTGSKFFFDDNC